MVKKLAWMVLLCHLPLFLYLLRYFGVHWEIVTPSRNAWVSTLPGYGLLGSGTASAVVAFVGRKLPRLSWMLLGFGVLGLACFLLVWGEFRFNEPVRKMVFGANYYYHAMR